MGFWTTTGVADPKRQFRFLLTIGSMPDGATWYATGVDKPAVTVGQTPHKYLNHTFYYPGNVEWSEVTATLVDPVSPDASANLTRILYESGYKIPMSPDDVSTISKSAAVSAVQGVTIEQIDSEGKPVETWTLNNAWVTNVDYGGKLAYGEDALTQVSVSFRYDWADIKTANAAVEGPGGVGGNRFWAPGQST